MTKLFITPALMSITIAAAALLVAVPAAAKDHSWQVGNDEYHVYFRDLDLKSSEGRAMMLRRIETAATKLCEARMSLKVDVDACIAQVVAQTAPRSPMLRLALNERSATRVAAK